MNIIKKQRGAILIEFVLCLPIMISLCFGMYELYRLYNAHTVTYNIATQIGMWSSVDTSVVSQYIQKGYDLGSSIDLKNQGSILVTGLRTGKADVNKTQWVMGSGVSGITKNSPNLSNSSAFSLDYQTIVVEVVYTYKPMISLSFISAQTLKKTFCIDYRGDSTLFTTIG